MQNNSTIKAYKVLYKACDGTLFSIFAPPPLRIEYKVGQEVFGSFGPILVLDTLENALDFAEHYERYSIWECEAVDAMYKNFLAVIGTMRREHDMVDRVQKFWSDGPSFSAPAPRGTMSASKIVLIKEVYNYA